MCECIHSSARDLSRFVFFLFPSILRRLFFVRCMSFWRLFSLNPLLYHFRLPLFDSTSWSDSFHSYCSPNQTLSIDRFFISTLPTRLCAISRFCFTRSLQTLLYFHRQIFRHSQIARSIVCFRSAPCYLSAPACFRILCLSALASLSPFLFFSDLSYKAYCISSRLSLYGFPLFPRCITCLSPSPTTVISH